MNPPAANTPEEEQEQQGPVVRDRRRIDPQTGELRDPGLSGPAAGASGAADAAPGPAQGAAPKPNGGATSSPPAASSGSAPPKRDEIEQELAERTADLQRLQAEYINYKRRVDRDKQAARELGIGGVLTELLPVLDDIGRAREHGELEGGFRAVAEALEAVVTKLGLEKYGEPGDEFDPRVHEALMHNYSDEVTTTTATTILQPGYRHGERVLRPARVAVSEPTAGFAAEGSGPGDQSPESSEDSPSEAPSSEAENEG